MFIKSEKGKLVPTEAQLSVKGVNKTTKSNEALGNYHRPLAPGKYTLVANKEGYKVATAAITVPASGNAVVRNFVLNKA